MQGRAVASNILLGRVDMGRSFESVRMAVKDVSARWLKASKALKKKTRFMGRGSQTWPGNTPARPSTPLMASPLSRLLSI